MRYASTLTAPCAATFAPWWICPAYAGLKKERSSMSYEETCKTVGKNIFKYRMRLGLSKRKLAELLQCDSASVRHWENGDFLPSSLFLPMLADLFKCSIDKLFGRESRCG